MTLLKMKEISIHHAVEREIACLDSRTVGDFKRYCRVLVEGLSLGMPESRPMPVVAHGVHELRLKDRFGQWRIFYYTKLKDRILVFHMFRKQTNKTPKHEIRLGKKRLRSML